MVKSKFTAIATSTALCTRLWAVGDPDAASHRVGMAAGATFGNGFTVTGLGCRCAIPRLPAHQCAAALVGGDHRTIVHSGGAGFAHDHDVDHKALFLAANAT